MAEIVNLNKQRKRRARADATAKAAENRIRYGLTAAERARDEAEATRAARAHAGRALGHESVSDAVQPAAGTTPLPPPGDDPPEPA